MPPSLKCVHTAARAPTLSAISRMAWCSLAKSPGKALMATTGETPCTFTFSICLIRLAAPARTSSGFSASRSAGSGLPATILNLPLCAFKARTVATSTAASGTMPEVRHLMLKNRSAPMSAPNPASVMR